MQIRRSRPGRLLTVTAVGVIAGGALWAATAQAVVKTTVTAQASASTGLFTGQVSSPKTQCKAKRTVRVILVGQGSIGTDKTNQKGRFSFAQGVNPTLQYYVLVPPKRVTINGKRVRCASARTPNFSPRP